MLRRIWTTALIAMMSIAGLSCQSTPPEEESGQPAEEQAASPPAQSKPELPARKFFQVKSAKIDFVYSGIFEGKETLYFDDWGNTVVIVADKKEYGNPVNQTIIWQDKQATIHNHLEEKSWQGRMRPKATEPPAIASVDESQLEMVGYQKLPDEQIAGKTCTVYDNSNLKVKYWLWQGIDLKIANRSVGQEGYVREAQNVEEDITIPADLLEAPAGYSQDN